MRHRGVGSRAKVAFCPASDGGYVAADARGFIWNVGTGSWVQTSDPDWSHFPYFALDSTGAVVAAQSTIDKSWAYIAFGDDSQTGTWNVYYLVRPTMGGPADVQVGPQSVSVTVLDMKTGGAWLHNGVSTGKTAPTRAK